MKDFDDMLRRGWKWAMEQQVRESESCVKLLNKRIWMKLDDGEELPLWMPVLC